MNKRLFLFVPLLCCLPVVADQLIVQHRDLSADKKEDIATIGKWVFVDDKVQLIDHQGYLLGEEYMENIIKITFSDTPWSPTSTEEAPPNMVIVYPNPTHEILCVQGVSDDAMLRIYSTAGQLLATAQGTQITIGQLPCGTYMLQIGTQVLRFVKE